VFVIALFVAVAADLCDGVCSVFVIALFVALAAGFFETVDLYCCLLAMTAGLCEGVHVSVARPVCVCMHACLCL
jgi:hypothetical protein